ncbi:peroxisomal membrane protein 11C isoform X2 [Molothrus ater]|uniref:peroxisomal membrane protein 11C isoform X2 n=1 Tax=Molothrus ater TaxID=84834 RepID=UPI00174DEE07|nr:peroxisomal membrane protein 11C isoform X2 [Molothrus ater]
MDEQPRFQHRRSRRSGLCPTAASWRGQRCPAPGGCPGGSWPPLPSSAPAAPPCASSTTWPCSGTAAATGWAPRVRTRWCGGSRCFPTWPTSCTTPASTWPGPPMSASSEPPPSGGGHGARRCGAVPCSWASCGTGWAPGGCALLLGILRSLRILFQLRRKLSQHKCTSPQRQQKLRAQVKAEVLSILMDTADLCNAIHWLPPGFLWAGRFPPWLVGLLGTISSLIGIYQASRGANSEAA